LKTYIKFLSVITFSLFIFACSGSEQAQEGNAQAGDAQKEEVKHTQRPEFDFRKARWGMSKEEVMASEREKLIFDNENSIEYRVFIGELQAQANYKFQDDKLIRGGYYFLKEYEDKNEYIKNYELLKERMIEAKGPPAIDKVVEINPSAQIDPENKGQAVCDGNIIYGSQWAYPGSDIQLVFRGDGTNCYLTITFLKSLPDEPADEKAAEEKGEEDKAQEDKAEAN